MRKRLTQYPLGGAIVREDGASLVIVAAWAGKLRRGYTRVVATEDGEDMARGVCECRTGGVRVVPTPGVVRAAEVVTEHDFYICGLCRKEIPDGQSQHLLSRRSALHSRVTGHGS